MKMEANCGRWVSGVSKKEWRWLDSEASGIYLESGKALQIWHYKVWEN